MLNMSDYLKQLELHDDLEAEVIKKTKVHKVLKAIIKLDSIPKEEEYDFKKRSNDLLGKWNGALAAESEPATATTPAEPPTNGVKHDEDQKAESAKETSAEKAEDEKKSDAPSEPAITKTADEDGDVPMSDGDKDIIKDAPAAKADTETTTITTEAATA